MRSLSALVLLTVAVGAGAGVYYLPDTDADGAAAIASARQADRPGNVQPATAPLAAGVPPADTSKRVFSAQTPLYGRPDQPVVAEKPRAGRGERLAEATVGGGEPIMRAGGGSTQDSRPVAGPATREDLTRSLTVDLHRELKRVGCYAGDLSTDWTAASKKAMKSFLERVNARLPVESPDHILLTLVKGHATEACGKGCPSGQSFDDDGKCVPRGLLVKAPAKEAPRSTGSAESVPQSPPKGPDRVMLSSSWTTEVAPTTSDVMAPMTRGAAATGSIATPAAPAVRPGRMALGAAPTVPQASAPAGARPLPPTLIQPPRAAPNRLAAGTLDTPNADADIDAVAKSRVQPRPDPVQRPALDVRPEAVYVPRPQPDPRRTANVQRSYSGGVSTYVPPSYRPAPNRDWKQTVFTKDSH